MSECMVSCLSLHIFHRRRLIGLKKHVQFLQIYDLFPIFNAFHPLYVLTSEMEVIK